MLRFRAKLQVQLTSCPQEARCQSNRVALLFPDQVSFRENEQLLKQYFDINKLFMNFIYVFINQLLEIYKLRDK